MRASGRAHESCDTHRETHLDVEDPHEESNGQDQFTVNSTKYGNTTEDGL